MRVIGEYGKVYSVEDLHQEINRVAEKELGISGDEAIQIIKERDWEDRDNITVWLWLKGLVNLLSSPINCDSFDDASIRQQSS